jgi:hypothetical protein
MSRSLSHRLLLALALLGCLAFGRSLPAQDLPFPRLSSFDARKISRDPFTPLDELGVVEKTQVVESIVGKGEKKIDLASLFRVSSISISKLSVAIVNGRAFAEGESFDLKGEGGVVKRVTILKIREGGVDLDCAGYNVSVNLERKEPKPIEER